MALILTSTQQKKITILGTDLEISSVYLRIQFNSRMNGKTLDIDASCYSNKDKYLVGTPVLVDIPSPRISIDIDPTTRTQGVETAHLILKDFYEDLGYTASIDLT